MRIERWAEVTDQALWVRAVERLDVPACGLVPGPLDEDDLPAPSARVHDPGLPAAWLAWWDAIARGAVVVARPDLGGIADAAGLGDVVSRRFDEFHRWHEARMQRGIDQWRDDMPAYARAHRWRAARPGTPGPDPLRETHLVADLERRLRRAAPPFVLDLLLLPVRDDVIREVRPDRYLVPERVYDGPDWPARLEPLVLRQLA